MIGEESVPLEVLSFFVGNNNPKKGLSPLIGGALCERNG